MGPTMKIKQHPSSFISYVINLHINSSISTTNKTNMKYSKRKSWCTRIQCTGGKYTTLTQVWKPMLLPTYNVHSINWKTRKKISFFGKLFLKWTYRSTSIFKQFKKSANTHCQAENNSPNQCRTMCTFSQLNDEIQGVTFLK